MPELSIQARRSRERRWKSALLAMFISVVAAVLLALLNDTYADLPEELLISLSIGGGIWLLVQAISVLSRGRIGALPALAIAVPLGIVAGFKFAVLLGAHDVISDWIADPLHQWRSISVSLLIAVSGSAFVIVVMTALDYRLQLETERRRSAEAGRAQTIAEIALLQAQIEPHFLFNTLAHVQSGIEQDPVLAKSMLEHLIRYLRSALRRSRSCSYTLAEEEELIESLLAIAAIRLGARLRYRVVIDDALRGAALPPLLLQPLVENAIKHGIEAAVAGGDICVQGQSSDGVLLLRVSDTGAGLAGAAPEGVGLSNVRARLASLYGERGQLRLHRNEPCGLIAELRLPLAYH
jgi:hypothetical protein